MSAPIFDLEQAVMNCWEIVEDLKLLRKTVPGLSASEEVQERIQAIESVYQMRFDEMWKIFEQVCSDHHKYRRMAETGRASPQGLDAAFDEIVDELNTRQLNKSVSEWETYKKNLSKENSTDLDGNSIGEAWHLHRGITDEIFR